MFGQFLMKHNAGGDHSGRHGSAAAGRVADKTSAVPGEQHNAASAALIGPATQAQPAAFASPVFGVLGAKGGVGATTLALNLAAALSAESEGALLIDANLQHPDAAVMMGLEPKYGLLDLLERRGEVDGQIIAACSTSFSETLPCRLISPPLNGSAASQAQPGQIAQCLQSWRSCAPAWVIDLPKHLDKHLVMLMDRCDRLLLVVEPTLAALSAARRWQSIFAELEYPAEKICLIVNRVGGKVKLVEEQLRQLERFSEAPRIPNAYDLTELSIARGEPAVTLNARSPYASAVKKLAHQLLEEARG